MSSEISVNAICMRAVILAAAMWLVAGDPLGGFAQAAQAMLNAEVPAAKWKAVRLKNLPKNAAVAISVEATGTIDIIFVHQDELKRFPAAVSPDFQGTVERKLSFSVLIPKAGDYYVIFDNRQGKDSQKVRVLIRAERPKSPDAGSPSPAPDKKKETRI